MLPNKTMLRGYYEKTIIILGILLSFVSFFLLLNNAYGYQEYIEGKCMKDETIYSLTTLEDEFSNDRIIVTLTRYASRNLTEFRTSDFPELKLESVK